MARTNIFVATTVLSGLLAFIGGVSAQVAGNAPPSAMPEPIAVPPSPPTAAIPPAVVGPATSIELSARSDLLGEAVLNDQKEIIGKVEDVVIVLGSGSSFVVLNAGRFVGVAEHNIAIPLEQLLVSGNDVILAGATRDALRALPRFEFTETGTRR
ncbi:MAG TPA: PRC-barrel domain-containing protein [Burkholderiales bacterium]|nr:PRC-barrel domain-containing protein [Burkholderiales bacterium]